MVRPAAAHLRRVLDASSWVVLEELLARSTVDIDALVAPASVRSIADALGVAKDTAGRALARLRELGLIEPTQARASAGTFAATTYLITVPADMFGFGHTPTVALTPTDAPTLTRVSTRQRRAARPDSQLSLLDV